MSNSTVQTPFRRRERPGKAPSDEQSSSENQAMPVEARATPVSPGPDQPDTCSFKTCHNFQLQSPYFAKNTQRFSAEDITYWTFQTAGRLSYKQLNILAAVENLAVGVKPTEVLEQGSCDEAVASEENTLFTTGSGCLAVFFFLFFLPFLSVFFCMLTTK